MHRGIQTDGNIPSLLSAPYLGYESADDPVYIWPLALLAQGPTCTAADRAKAQALLLAGDPGDGRLHESFDPNNPKRFMRKNFGWPNSLMAEFVLRAKGGSSPLPAGSTDGLSFGR